MDTEVKRFLKYLHLVREDIREEIDLLGIPHNQRRICDYGCGNGLTTFGLALETEGAKFIGVDLFDHDSQPTPEELNEYMAFIESEFDRLSSPKNAFLEDLWVLAHEKRWPQFTRGNIVLNQNLPENIDMAYCKKVLVNFWGKEYKDTPSGEDGVRLGLNHLTKNLKPVGLMCAVEYDRDFGLEKYLEMSRLSIIKRAQIKRREIRSRGRTNTISNFALYLCRKL
jgi:SAM-dependent methyltransferase